VMFPAYSIELSCFTHSAHWSSLVIPDGWGSRIRFPAGAGNFSLHHRVQKGSGAHPASYPMGTRDSFLGIKRPGREAAHLHLMPRSRMHGAIPPLPNTSSWRGA
jgi:hypothetical protein